MRVLLFLSLLWMLAVPTALAEELCGTPRDAAASLVDNLQQDSWDQERAAACLDVSEAREQARERLALQLKRVLDARGLYVPTGSISTDPDYTDDAGEHRLVVIDALPQVYLIKKGDRWLYSRSTVQLIPELYEQTFSSAMIQLQKRLPPVFFQRIFGLFLWQYVYFLLLLAAAMGVGRTAQFILTRQVVRAAKRLELSVDLSLLRRIRGPLTWFAAGLVFRLGIPDLQLGVAPSFFLNFIATSVLSLSAVIIATRAVDVAGDLFGKRAEQTDSKLDDQVIPLVSRATKSALWALGFIFILQNIGVEVTALLAGVSVGGVAVALAAQDTIGNLFGSLTIFTDRPFQIGDWVIIGGDIEGVVEEVGFRSTRIRTFGKSVVSVPNAKVANSSVDNMGKRTYRRLKLDLGLRYDTPPASLRAFLAGVEAILVDHPHIWQDTIEVRLTNFGDSALEVMVYTFLDVPDWTAELKEKQEILLRIMEVAEELQIGFAFPSLSIYREGGA